MTIYALETPEGELVPATISEYQDECWGQSFEHVAAYCKHNGFTYRKQTRFDFRELFWKKWDASLRAAERRGFKIVECELKKVAS